MPMHCERSDKGCGEEGDCYCGCADCKAAEAYEEDISEDESDEQHI